MKTLTFTGLLAAVLFSVSASAALVDNGNSTIDTSTNLEWLDLTMTAGETTPFGAPADGGVSVDDLINGFGGLFAAGYRHATEAEVLALWASVGLTGDGTYDPAYIPGVTTLIGLLGEPSPDDDPNPRGIYQFELNSSTAYNIGDLQLVLTSEGLVVSANSSIHINGDSDIGIYWQQSGAGHYLVRTSETPIPPTVWLFGSALLGLVGLKQRR